MKDNDRHQMIQLINKAFISDKIIKNMSYK